MVPEVDVISFRSESQTEESCWLEPRGRCKRSKIGWSSALGRSLRTEFRFEGLKGRRMVFEHEISAFRQGSRRWRVLYNGQAIR